MRLKKLVIQGLIAAVLVIGVGLTTMTGSFANSNQHQTQNSPTNQQIAFAQRTSDLMLNTLFAALTQEFNETTSENVAEGSHSISLIFNDKNKDMRLVGTVQPLRKSDRPSDDFERRADALAMSAGQPLTAVERMDEKWFYRRSIPLSNFRMECSKCHVNYPVGPTADRVGALMLRVPIKQ